MKSVSVRDLRNHGGEVLERVRSGERILVTRSGEPIAELLPLSRRPVPLAALLEHWASLPPLDPESLRSDLDALIASGI